MDFLNIELWNTGDLILSRRNLGYTGWRVTVACLEQPCLLKKQSNLLTNWFMRIDYIPIAMEGGGDATNKKEEL